MTIREYSGKTYVAFLDLSGFKEMMKRQEQAANALDRFYNTIYHVGRGFTRANISSRLLEVNEIVVSDCAILFSRNGEGEQDKIDGLRSVLSFIQQVNRYLISSTQSLMATCVVDYGNFRYEDRIEFDGIGKDCFVGQPYLNAFLDNELGSPRIQPGQCRLLRKNLPTNVESTTDMPLSLLHGSNDQKYYYFYWMLDNLDVLQRFERDYRDTYQLKYTGMISVLKRYVGNVPASF
jgi:hypothetical protein